MESQAEPVASTLERAFLEGERAPALDARLASRLLVGAVLLGLLTQLLFYGQVAGINVLLGTAALLGAAALARRRDATFDRWDLWLPPAALLFAAFVAVRADPALIAFDLLAALGLTGAAAAAISGAAVTRRSFVGVVGLAFDALGAVLAGASRLAPGLSLWAAMPRRLDGSPARPILLGLLLALPFVLVFAGLFASADPVFARIIERTFRPPDLGDLPLRLVVAAIGAWAAGGLLVFVAARREAREPTAEAGTSTESGADATASASLRVLDPTVAATALLVIDLLFALFVALQAAYLFGGRDTLEAVAMTYSQYARRGFFELIAVAFVAGGLVLAVEAFLTGRSRLYMAAVAALSALTAVILLSATVRLALYQQAYGWTELRFYALAAIGWLAFGVAATIVAVLAGRTRWLLHALVIGGLLVAAAVNVIGPQAFVASANVQRVIHPELVPPDGEATLDAEYLGLLGADAVPVLVEALPLLPPGERDRIAELLRGRQLGLRYEAPTSWPSWNLARERARAALARLSSID